MLTGEGRPTLIVAGAVSQARPVLERGKLAEQEQQQATRWWSFLSALLWT